MSASKFLLIFKELHSVISEKTELLKCFTACWILPRVSYFFYLSELMQRNCFLRILRTSLHHNEDDAPELTSLFMSGCLLWQLTLMCCICRGSLRIYTELQHFKQNDISSQRFLQVSEEVGRTEGNLESGGDQSISGRVFCNFCIYQVYCSSGGGEGREDNTILMHVQDEKVIYCRLMGKQEVKREE